MMDFNGDILATAIPGWAGLWLWIVIRLAGLFLLVPVLSHTATFPKMRVLLILVLASCLLPMVQTRVLEAGDVWALSPMESWRLADVLAGVFHEMLFGLLLGLAAAAPLAAVQMGGHLIDQQMGISIGEIYNPEADASLSVTAQALHMTGMFVFVQIGGVEQMLLLLASSYETFGPGQGANWLALGEMAAGLLQWSAELALRVAAPLLCLIFLESLAMGFMARTVPQINVLTIGFTIRILTGFGLMVLSAGDAVMFLTDAYAEVFGQLQQWIANAG